MYGCDLESNGRIVRSLSVDCNRKDWLLWFDGTGEDGSKTDKIRTTVTIHGREDHQAIHQTLEASHRFFFPSEPESQVIHPQQDKEETGIQNQTQIQIQIQIQTQMVMVVTEIKMKM